MRALKTVYRSGGKSRKKRTKVVLRDRPLVREPRPIPKELRKFILYEYAYSTTGTRRR